MGAMKAYAHPVLVITFALTRLLGQESATLAKEETADTTLESRVDDFLAPYMETGNFSGSVLIGRKGEVLLSKGYGLSNIELDVPNSPETIFYLASVSRIFTSAAILLLEQNGELSTEDMLADFVPAWPRGDEISIHHLMTTSAGFPNVNSLPGYGMWSMTKQTPRSMAHKFINMPLEYEPGARTEHSNSNLVVLAGLIEIISGKDFGDYLQDEIFAPLEMTRTGHDADSGIVVPGRATGYAPVGLAELGKAPYLNWSVKPGHGSIYSSTEDLYKFDRALAKATLLEEEAVAKLFKPYFPRTGYSWFMRERFGSKEVYMSGRSPGFGAFLGRSVDEDLTVVVLGNLYNALPGSIGPDLIALALGEKVTATAMSTDEPDPELLQELVGSYQFGPEFYLPNAVVGIHVQAGHLFNGGSWLIPSKGMHFIHRGYWSDLIFERDEAGKVTRLRYDSHVGEKR